MRIKNVMAVFGAVALGIYLLAYRHTARGTPPPPYARGDVLTVVIPVINVQAYTTIIETVLEQDGTWTVYAKSGMYPNYDPPDCMNGPLNALLSEGWVYHSHIELPDTEHCTIFP